MRLPYDFFRIAVQTSEKFKIPVILRMTTRVDHSKSIVVPKEELPAMVPNFERNIAQHVMVPGFSKPAGRKLRAKMDEMEAWNVAEGPNKVEMRSADMGIIVSGISYHHVREAAPEASDVLDGLLRERGTALAHVTALEVRCHGADKAVDAEPVVAPVASVFGGHQCVHDIDRNVAVGYVYAVVRVEESAQELVSVVIEDSRFS